MEHRIGDCIAKLRKEKGWTQDVLADKLQVSNKAISKWESNKGEPSLEFLPKLAELFGITLDYLMTGKKVEEVVNYDDMDAEKRAVRIVLNDDLENFEKYKYNNDSILYHRETDYHNRYDNSYNLFQINSKIREAIYTNESKKIFSLVVSTFMNSQKVKNTFIRNNYNQFFLIKEKDDFIKMCALCNRVDVLQELGVRNFKIISDTESNINEVYCIKESTVNFILTNNEVSKEVLDYICDVNSPTTREEMNNSQNEMLIYLIYKAKRFDYLKNILKRYDENAERILNKKHELEEENKGYLFINNAKLHYNQNNLNFNRKDYSIELADDYYKSNRSLLGFILPITKAFDYAISNNDIEWIKNFNEYNRKIATEFGIECRRFNDKEIKLIEMRLDKKEKLENIIIYSNVENKLINLNKLYSSLMNELKHEEENEKIEYLKKIVKESKKTFETIDKNYYICYREFIEDCLSRNDYKTIFEFAMDNNLPELQKAVISANNDEIRKVIECLFGYSSDYVKEYSLLVNKQNDISKRLQEANINKNAWAQSSLMHESAAVANSIIAFKKRILVSNNDKVLKMFEYQFECCPFLFSTNEENVYVKCKECKEKMFNDFINQIKEYIEKVTHENAMAEEYEKIQNEISFEYLENEIKNGNFDNAVVKLCVRLEACLKYKYRYEGDLFTMLDNYSATHLQWPNAWDDDYDGANAEVDHIKDTLHKLRLKRNNVVHAENNNVNFTEHDALNCVEILKKM